MKKSLDRARMKFMRKHRKDWHPTKKALEQLNSSQALDFLGSKGEFNPRKIAEKYKKTFQALPELEPIPLDDLPFSLLGVNPEKINF